MKKTKFYILTSNNGQLTAQQVSGYAETIDGVPIGIHKKGGEWIATELTTGCRFTQGRTRKDAQENALQWLPKVVLTIANESFDRSKNTIRAAYNM